MISIDLGIVIAIIAAVLGGMGAFRSRSNANTKTKELKRRMQTIKDKEAMQREVQNLDGESLLDGFDWLREQRNKRR